MTLVKRRVITKWIKNLGKRPKEKYTDKKCLKGNSYELAALIAFSGQQH